MTSVLLVHGAGTGPWIFDGWGDVFPQETLVAVDLHEGLDVSDASIGDYADAVVRAAAPLMRPLVVVGWSLGGLVSMVAAAGADPDALVLLDASPPLEVQGERDVPLVRGSFDPEDAGAVFPPGVRKRRESRLAMAERDRGVSVSRLPMPTLVVFSAALREDRGPRLARRYGADQLDAGNASHWDLVLDPAIRREIARWTRSRGTLGVARGGLQRSGSVP